MTFDYKRYATIYLIGLVVMIVLSVFLQSLSLGAVLPGMIVILPALPAAYAEGARQSAAEVEGAPAWGLALKMTLIVFFITFAILLLQLLLPGLPGLIGPVSLPLLIAVYAILLIAVLVANRLCYALGARKAKAG